MQRKQIKQKKSSGPKLVSRYKFKVHVVPDDSGNNVAEEGIVTPNYSTTYTDLFGPVQIFKDYYVGYMLPRDGSPLYLVTRTSNPSTEIKFDDLNTKGIIIDDD